MLVKAARMEEVIVTPRRGTAAMYVRLSNHRAEALAALSLAGHRPNSRWSTSHAPTFPEDTHPRQGTLPHFCACQARDRSCPCQCHISKHRLRSDLWRNSRQPAVLRQRSRSGNEQLDRFLGHSLRKAALPERLARVWSVSRGASQQDGLDSESDRRRYSLLSRGGPRRKRRR